jgi:leader peptidase (prepilin peptidase)/N-methyltransferase
MIRPLGTGFAAFLGLIFGSFLNVCLSRWPVGESISNSGSHCRHCDHAIPWYENIPLLSFLTLGGRCRKCNHPIGLRYPIVEASVALLWGYSAWQIPLGLFDPQLPKVILDNTMMVFAGKLLFYWLMVALAFLDWENLWLPDWLTLPGTAAGFALGLLSALLLGGWGAFVPPPYYDLTGLITDTLLGIGGAALLILLIRWIYFLIRRREGVGLGDAKLMALLAAWMGLPLALLSFAIGVILAAIAGVFVLAGSRKRPQAVVVQADGETSGSVPPTADALPSSPADAPIPANAVPEFSTAAADPVGARKFARLPLGTFLCIGGIVAHLWGQRILAAYLEMFNMN